MADKRITDLTSATTLNLADFFVIVQGGTTVNITAQTLLSNLPQAPITVQPAETPASGALSTAVRDSLVTSASGATAYTLAAGTHGTRKLIACSTLGASATAAVTVTGGAGFTTITFSAIGQNAELENISGTWFVTSSRGVTIV